MHYIHKVGCTSVRQVPVTGTCSFRLTTQIWRDLCLSETQIHRSSDLWVSHRYTCVDPQVTQTHAQPYLRVHLLVIRRSLSPTAEHSSEESINRIMRHFMRMIHSNEYSCRTSSSYSPAINSSTLNCTILKISHDLAISF